MHKRSQLLSLVGVAVISGAIYFLVQGAQQEQTIRTQASDSIASVYISPKEKIMPPASSFNVVAESPAGFKNVMLSFEYDPSILELNSAPFAADNRLQITESTPPVEANASGKLTIKLSAATEINDGMVQLLTLDFNTLSQEVLETTLHLDNLNSYIEDNNQNKIPFEVDHANISVRPQE